MSEISVGDWVLVFETGEKLQIIAITRPPVSAAKTIVSYITSDRVRRRLEDIEKYVDMSDDFDNMITIVLEHKQLENIINVKLDNKDFNGLDSLIQDKKQLEKKYEDCVKK